MPAPRDAYDRRKVGDPSVDRCTLCGRMNRQTVGTVHLCPTCDAPAVAAIRANEATT